MQGTGIDTLRHQPPAAAAVALPISAGEMAASAIGAQARATVLARYEMALRQPRDLEVVRQDLMRECRRPTFANNKSAYYKKPIGDGVEGLGIRFVEVALRCMKNVLIESMLVYEDELKEVHKVVVTDLQSNTTYPQDVKVSKTVERKKPNDDGSYISVRNNSYGKAVYTVQATDDDLLNKRAALISKAIRTLGLRVIPGWMQDEAESIIKEVREDDAAQDPDAAKRKIIDAFGEINVTIPQLEEYLGHPVGECSAKEITDLRGFYGAIRDEETTWAAVMEHRRDKGAEPKKPPGDEKTKSAKDLQQAGSATGAAQQQDKPAAPREEPRTPARPAAAPASDVMFTVVDALAHVARGEYNQARDLARKFSDLDKKKVETAIKARGGPAAPEEVPAEQKPQAKAEEPEERGEPLPPARESDVDLADVLTAIKDSKTEADIVAAGTLIEELPPDDQVTARTKWQTRKNEIGAPPVKRAPRRGLE